MPDLANNAAAGGAAAAVSGGSYTAREPASGAELAKISLSEPGEIESIVQAVAKVQPLWALLRVQDRARYMRNIAQAVIDERDSLIETICREQSRPRAEIATLELLPAIDALGWLAQDGVRALAMRTVRVPRTIFPLKRAKIAFEPFGVVGVIGAGSAPFVQPLGQIAGALLAGNGVVFKPALRAALTAESIMRVIARAGLPEGLVRIVHGGAPAGIALAQAHVEKVMFTGSPSVGRAVARACVSRETEVTVELGGKDAMLVLDDANIESAARCALWAGCAGAGQARGALERIYVARELHEPFVRELTDRARAITVGDPHAMDVQMGPLASERRLEHVRALVEDALANGAHVLCGGSGELARGDSSRGAGDAPVDAPAAEGARASTLRPPYYPPTVLTGVRHDMRIMREPLGGPVLAVMAFDSIDEALALANDSEYSLGASIFSADRYQALRIARELRAGMVWVNDHLPSPGVARGPWGAFSHGGLGKTLGLAGLRASAQEKLITHDPVRVPGLWWSPYEQAHLRAALALALWRSERRPDRERARRNAALALGRLLPRTFARR